MKRWLVIGADGVMKIVAQEDTPAGAAYAAADRLGIASGRMTVYPLGEPVTYDRGWVKSVPRNS